MFFRSGQSFYFCSFQPYLLHKKNFCNISIIVLALVDSPRSLGLVVRVVSCCLQYNLSSTRMVFSSLCRSKFFLFLNSRAELPDLLRGWPGSSSKHSPFRCFRKNRSWKPSHQVNAEALSGEKPTLVTYLSQLTRDRSDDATILKKLLLFLLFDRWWVWLVSYRGRQKLFLINEHSWARAQVPAIAATYLTCICMQT